MLISGQDAGRMVERRVEEGGLLVHETTLRLDVARSGTAIRMELSERFVETVEHEPVSMRVTQRLGSAPITTEYSFDGDEVVVATAAGTSRRPVPRGTWSTPSQVASTLRRQSSTAMRRGTGGDETSFRVRALEPLVGLEPVTVRYELEAARDSVAIGGHTFPASRWRMTTSYAAASPSTVWLSPGGELLRSEAQMMGLEVVTLYAPHPLDGSAREPADLPEILTQTFVFPDRPIENPRSVRRGVYLLRAEGVDLELLVPDAGVQRVEAVEDDRSALRVEVDLDAPRRPREDASTSPYLDASSYVDHEHPAVRALLAEPADADEAGAAEAGAAEAGAAEAETDRARRAETLRRRVARHLGEKNLGTALGSASQAAEARAGDCTEHAVLLAALLRAEGIPSRVAIGLIYAERFAGREDLFGYHMWTQALVDGRWLDLDATLADDTPFDATHLLFGTDALAGDGVPLLTTGLEGLMGRLEIEVISVADPVP